MKTYILTHPSVIERQENAHALRLRLEKMGFNAKIFIGLDKKDENLMFKLGEPMRNKGMSLGQYCCAWGHQRLYEKCIKANEPILIVEDDAEFLNEEYLDICLDSFPDKFDSLHLNTADPKGEGGIGPGNSIIPKKCELDVYDEVWYKPKNGWGVWGTSAFIVSPSGANKLLKNGINIIADVPFKWNHGQLDSYYAINEPFSWGMEKSTL